MEPMSLFYVMLNLMARIIVLFIAFPIHETAHAYVAQKLGDPTAKNMGRIDLNPFSHMNPLPCFGVILLASVMDYFTGNATTGTLLLLLASIFFFYPVPINPNYFKHRKAGIAITALAGPVANILLGALFMILVKVITYFVPSNEVVSIIGLVFTYTLSINLQLAAFNLLPLPPLDGSKVLSFFLPDRINYMIAQYQTYITLGVIVLLYFTNILDYFINFIYNGLYTAVNFLTSFIDLLAQVV